MAPVTFPTRSLDCKGNPYPTQLIEQCCTFKLSPTQPIHQHDLHTLNKGIYNGFTKLSLSLDEEMGLFGPVNHNACRVPEVPSLALLNAQTR